MADTFAAYSVYYYNNQSVGFGMAGLINDDGSTVTPVPDLNTDLNGDPKVAGFAGTGDALRLAVTDYAGNVTDQNVYIYEADSGTLLDTVVWPAVDNLYSLVKVGGYLYAIDYDNARVVEINPATYAQTGVSYTLASGFVPSGYVAHGQTLIELAGTLYGLFTFVTSDWSSYADSLLVRFTIVPGTSISVATSGDTNGTFAKNAFAMAASGTDLYVTAIGGSQGASGVPNAASRLQKIAYAAADLSTAAITDVMSPSVTSPYELRDISFDGTTAYVLMGTYNAAWQLAGQLVRTSDFVTFTTVNDFSTGAGGYFWSAQYTADNDRIWFAQGNQILIYNASSIATPPTALTLSDGSLISTGELYDNLNDLSYVGKVGARMNMRGYRSPLQASRTAKAMQARAITAGRPELTEEELSRLNGGIATA